MKALSIKGLRKTYEGGVEALKGISIDVEKGDFFGMLGPNGAGKTTAIGIVTTLVNKTGGNVRIFGKDLDTDPELCKSYLGLVPQEFNFNIFEKVEDIIVQQAGYYGIPRAEACVRTEKLLKQLGLWEKRKVISNTLSGGMKRKLMIVRALIHKPRVLILDEPTAGVDVDTRRSMWDFIRRLNEKGMTIILTTHYLEEAEQLCKNLAIINNGEVIENTTVKGLINRMDKETFVIDTKNKVKGLKLKEYNAVVVDENTIEVEISRKQNINDLVHRLDKQGIEIVSMRNKTNRLEELFVGIVANGKKGGGK